MFNSLSKKEWKGVEWNSKKRCTIENKNYNSKNKRPNWCKKQNRKKIPQYRCLISKCPFFSFVNSSSKDYRKFDKAFSKG